MRIWEVSLPRKASELFTPAIRNPSKQKNWTHKGKAMTQLSNQSSGDHSDLVHMMNLIRPSPRTGKEMAELDSLITKKLENDKHLTIRARPVISVATPPRLIRHGRRA